jgi:hypothetical protein
MRVLLGLLQERSYGFVGAAHGREQKNNRGHGPLLQIHNPLHNRFAAMGR